MKYIIYSYEKDSDLAYIENTETNVTYVIESSLQQLHDELTHENLWYPNLNIDRAEGNILCRFDSLEQFKADYPEYFV